MANFTHPLTGVPLNVILYKRSALNEAEAITAHILRRQGVSYTDIVHKLGTNANRVGEVFRGQAWPDSGRKAMLILGDDLFTLH